MFKVLSSTSRCFPDIRCIKITLSEKTISIFDQAKKHLFNIQFQPQHKLLGRRKPDESRILVKCIVEQCESTIFLKHAEGCPFDIGFVPIDFKEIEEFSPGVYYVYVTSISKKHQTGTLFLFNESTTVAEAKKIKKELQKVEHREDGQALDLDESGKIPAQIDELNQKGPQFSGLKQNPEVSHGLETLIKNVTATIETSEKSAEFVDLFKKVKTKSQNRIKACIDLAVKNLRNFLDILKFKKKSQQITNVELLKFQDSFTQLFNEFDVWCNELKSNIEKHQSQKAREHENKLLKKAKAQAQALEKGQPSKKKVRLKPCPQFPKFRLYPHRLSLQICWKDLILNSRFTLNNF